LHHSRYRIPSLSAVGGTSHQDAVGPRAVSPVPRQAVALDPEDAEEEIALVIENQRRIAATPSAGGPGLNGREGAPGIGGVGSPASPQAEHLGRIDVIDRDGRFASGAAGGCNRDDVSPR